MDRIETETNLLSRMNRLPITRVQVTIVVLLVLAWIIEAFDIGIVGSSILMLKKLWDLNAGQLGVLGISSTIGIALGLIPSGRLADLYGRKKILLYGVAVFGTFTLLAAFTPSFWAIVVFRGLAGLGEGAVFPIPYLMLSEFINISRRGASVGVSNGALTAAYVFPSLVGAWAINSFPLAEAWRIPYFMGGIPLLFLVPLALWLPESPRFLLKKDRIDEVRHLVEKIETYAHIPHDNQVMDRPVLTILRETGNRPIHYSTLFRSPYLSRSIISWLAYTGTLFMFYTMLVYSPTIFHSEGFTLGNATLLTGLLMVVAGGGSLVQGYLSDYLGRKWLYGIFAGIAVVGLLLLAFHVSKSWMIGAGILTFLFGLGIYPVAKLYIAEQYPTRLRGTGSAFGEMIARTIAGIGFAYIVPTILVVGGVKTVFLIVAIAMVVLVTPAMIWGRETSNISIEESGTDLSLGVPSSPQATGL